MKSLIAAILVGGLTFAFLISFDFDDDDNILWLISVILSGTLTSFVYRKMSKIETAAAKNKALNRLEKIIKLNPNSAAAYYKHGKYHAERREFEEAIADFTEAIRLGDSELDYKFYLERGWAFQSSRFYDEAIADYSQSIELNPGCEDAYFERGWIYAEQKKDYDAAIQDFNRVIELNPHNPDAKSYLAIFEIERSGAKAAFGSRDFAAESKTAADHQKPAATKDAWTSPILTGSYESPKSWYKGDPSDTSYDG